MMEKEILYHVRVNTQIFGFELVCQCFYAPLWMFDFLYQNRNGFKLRREPLGLRYD